jgi:hypothetical protein
VHDCRAASHLGQSSLSTIGTGVFRSTPMPRTYAGEEGNQSGPAVGATQPHGSGATGLEQSAGWRILLMLFLRASAMRRLHYAHRRVMTLGKPTTYGLRRGTVRHQARRMPCQPFYVCRPLRTGESDRRQVATFAGLSRSLSLSLPPLGGPNSLAGPVLAPAWTCLRE